MRCTSLVSSSSETRKQRHSEDKLLVQSYTAINGGARIWTLEVWLPSACLRLLGCVICHFDEVMSLTFSLWPMVAKLTDGRSCVAVGFLPCSESRRQHRTAEEVTRDPPHTSAMSLKSQLHSLTWQKPHRHAVLEVRTSQTPFCISKCPLSWSHPWPH